MHALPLGDAWYGVDPAGGGYILHAGAPGAPLDRQFDQLQNFLVMVEVDGAGVTARTVSTAGEVWEEIRLA